MKQYLEVLKDIYENGISLPDRTGNGRRKVFSRQIRFNLRDGFPLVTTRKVFTRGIIEELLWFIKGNINNKDLTDKNVHIWDSWTLNENHIAPFIKKFFPDIIEDSEEWATMYGNLLKKVDTIGPMYGLTWRMTPGVTHKFIDYETLAEDKKKIVDGIFEDKIKLANIWADPLEVTKDDIATHIYGGVIDQLQELITGLKNKPFSSRHVISAWVPGFIPDESISPQENILFGRGALAPCHVFQQYLVLPPDKEGGKMRLCLDLTQR